MLLTNVRAAGPPVWLLIMEMLKKKNRRKKKEERRKEHAVYEDININDCRGGPRTTECNHRPLEVHQQQTI
jgi:hypothetical protein